MEVCDVCGAFLIIGDAQTRVDDHLQGKQHMGYAKIKSTIEELRVRVHCHCCFHLQVWRTLLHFAFSRPIARANKLRKSAVLALSHGNACYTCLVSRCCCQIYIFLKSQFPFDL